LRLRVLPLEKFTSNREKVTPGVDGVILNSPAKKFEAINLVKNLKGYKASPVRRVYILKPDGKRRPLGIPTVKDRIVQTLYLFALDPIAEKTFDSRSYGFRQFRGVHDNLTYLKLVLGSYTGDPKVYF
jgi:RNA-directed DNA polymerase